MLTKDLPLPISEFISEDFPPAPIFTSKSIGRATGGHHDSSASVQPLPVRLMKEEALQLARYRRGLDTEEPAASIRGRLQTTWIL